MFSRSAFTLTELLIAVTITAMIILAVSSVDVMSHSFFADMQRRSLVQDELKIAMEHIAKNLQLGNGDPTGGNSGFSLPAGDGGSQLLIRQDSDNDGRPDTTNTYNLVSNRITFNGAAITDAHIIGLVFNQVTSNASCSYPNAVEVTITGRENPAAGPGLDNPEISLTSSIVLRAMACN